MKEKYKQPEKIENQEIGEYLVVNQAVTDLKNVISVLGNSGFEAFKSIFNK